MKEPRGFALSTGQFAIPDGSGDRFSGYAVIGLPFSSGHVLALRRIEASSFGPAYTSVWHRDPEGRWTFHQNVPPEQSCPRYFGAALSETTTGPIRINWTGRCWATSVYRSAESSPFSPQSWKGSGTEEQTLASSRSMGDVPRPSRSVRRTISEDR